MTENELEEFPFIEEVNGNILKEKTGIIVHGVNCQGKMGAGIALQIRNLFPQSYNDYLNYIKKKRNLSNIETKPTSVLLGDIVCTKITNELIIVSAFTQNYYGKDKTVRYVSYDAVSECFKNIAVLAYTLKLPVLFPKIGSGYGGGNWNVISKIIEDELLYVKNKKLFVL